MRKKFVGKRKFMYKKPHSTTIKEYGSLEILNKQVDFFKERPLFTFQSLQIHIHDQEQ